MTICIVISGKVGAGDAPSQSEQSSMPQKPKSKPSAAAGAPEAGE